jgi:hypothetical protein
VCIAVVLDDLRTSDMISHVAKQARIQDRECLREVEIRQYNDPR